MLLPQRLALLAIALAAGAAHAQQGTVLAVVVSDASFETELSLRPDPASPANDGQRSLVYFGGAERRVQLRLAEAFLCAGFGSPGGNVSARLIDPNGDATDLHGIALYNVGADSGGFRLVRQNGGLQFRIAANGVARCHGFPSVRGEPPPEQLFANGFEGLLPGVDLAVDLSVPTSVTVGQNFSYAVRVRNVGDTAVSGVVVKDWYPKVIQATAPSDPVVGDPTGGPNIVCSPGGGATCGTVAANGNLAVTGASLPGGGQLVYTITRVVSPPLPASPSFRIRAAAFAPMAVNEVSQANNPASSTPVQVLSTVAGD